MACDLQSEWRARSGHILQEEDSRMHKRATKTKMQDHNLRQECSALWGGNRRATELVAFRVTSSVGEPQAMNPDTTPQWPLTAEEEEFLCGAVRGM